MDSLKIGAHYSIRGGVAGAAKAALADGAGAFQYFSKNPRSLSVKKWNQSDAQTCIAIGAQNALVSVIHTPYPGNLAADPAAEEELHLKTAASLRNDLEMAEAYGSIGIVVHFGNFKQRNPLQGYKNIIQCIDKILDSWKGSAKLLLENQAGNHGDMGMTMEELLQVRKLCGNPDHVGFCLDTCHAFAAGMWMGAEDTLFFKKAEQLGFWEHVDCIHLNDSVYPAGSRRDRHARVGQGFIGAAGFRRLLGTRRVRDVPLIMETEAGSDHTYREDIALVTSWGNER